jgi:hypothetical protein
MKKLLLAAVAAVGLTIGLAPAQASAAWMVRTAYRWDPVCCRYVAYPERCWVPDCAPVYHHGHRDRAFHHGAWHHR